MLLGGRGSAVCVRGTSTNSRRLLRPWPRSPTTQPHGDRGRPGPGRGGARRRTRRRTRGPPLLRSPARSTFSSTMTACRSSVGGGRIRSWILGRRRWGSGTAASATRFFSTPACRSWAGTTRSTRPRWSSTGVSSPGATGLPGIRRPPPGWRRTSRSSGPSTSSARGRRVGPGPATRWEGGRKRRRRGRRKCPNLPPHTLPVGRGRGAAWHAREGGGRIREGGGG